ncbi:MAG: BMP family ABC transporter substrate-binding protein [Candidatus Poribacteria bacterium]|nr:BMP family ABC transporter substrate-binding protein [Candidatus Poribacteria bacterium]
MQSQLLRIFIILVTLTFLLAGSSLQNVHAAKAKRIGLIYDTGGRGDLSFCDASYAGARKAVDQWQLELKEITPGQSTDIEFALRQLARLKYDLIIGVGFLFQEPMSRVAAEFPDARFAIVDVEAKGQNIASLIFKAHEGTYLVGAIAALKTESNKIGFIGGMNIPLLHSFEAGYRAGAKAVNPDVEVFASYAGVTPQAFSDPAKGKELALAQYNRGADVILAAAGATSLGILEAAKEKQKYIIWVDANGNHLAPGLVLTSIIKGVELSVYQMIQSVVEGDFAGGTKVYGLKEGGAEYIVDENNRELLSEEILARVEALKKQIIDGEIVVPSERE